MTWLLTYWKPLAIAALAALALYGAYHHGVTLTDEQWQVRWSKRDAGDAVAQAAAELQVREQEHTWQDQAEANQNDAVKKLAVAQVAIDVGSADSQRLRDELTRLQSRLGSAGSNSTAGTGSASGTRAAMVLSDLLGSCSGKRQELAAAVDRSRIAGLACEAQYDSLRAGQLGR